MLLNLIPVCAGSFFPSLDGPAHLYNSNLINSLLFCKSEVMHSYFVLNPELIPNWTGHFILSVFNFFLPAFIAEKVFVITYLIALPISFRALIKTTSPNNYLLSYFIFPFTYSYLFFLGFYNFSIALIFLFVTLNFWMRNQHSKPTLYKSIILFVLFLSTYFSHVFVFAILLLVIGIQIGFYSIISYTTEKKELTKRTLIKNLILFFSCSIIPLLLLVNYFYKREMGVDAFVEKSELFSWIKNIRPLIAFNFEKEEMYSIGLFYLLFSITAILIYTRVGSFSNIKNIFSFIKHMKHSDIWLISAIIMLFLYFNLPDSDGQAGYVSIRLCLLFYLFLILWVSTQNISKWFSIVTILIILYNNFNLNAYYYSVTKELNKIAEECHSVSNFIKPNSIVLPINKSDSWLYSHYSNYLGIDKPMVILENYEASTGYFPIKWNENDLPNTIENEKNFFGCLNWKNNINNQKRKQIDYVFILGEIDSTKNSCDSTINFVLTKNYKQVFKGNFSSLYKKTSL
jgi:hypothetical protein